MTNFETIFYTRAPSYYYYTFYIYKYNTNKITQYFIYKKQKCLSLKKKEFGKTKIYRMEK